MSRRCILNSPTGSQLQDDLRLQSRHSVDSEAMALFPGRTMTGILSSYARRPNRWMYHDGWMGWRIDSAVSLGTPESTLAKRVSSSLFGGLCSNRDRQGLLSAYLGPNLIIRAICRMSPWRPAVDPSLLECIEVVRLEQ